MGYITTGADHSLARAYRLVGVLVMRLRMMFLAVRDAGQALQCLRVCHSTDFLYGGCRLIGSQKPEEALSVEATERRQGPTERRRMATIATESGPPKSRRKAISCGTGNCRHTLAIRWKRQLMRDLEQPVEPATASEIHACRLMRSGLQGCEASKTTTPGDKMRQNRKSRYTVAIIGGSIRVGSWMHLPGAVDHWGRPRSLPQNGRRPMIDGTCQPAESTRFVFKPCPPP